ncbi:MAG: phosphatase PAP2 family protein [Gammaproteobacteria bacterium]
MIRTVTVKFDQFFTFHFVIPFLAFAIAFAGLEFARLDLWFSQYFYDGDKAYWPFQNHWLIETVFHRWGSGLMALAGATAILCLLLSLSRQSKLHRYRTPLAFLILAGLSGPLLIAWLKNNTHIYCPRDLTLYGGDKPYIRLFDLAPPYLEIGSCFPAAHAGSGYAFVSLYFFLYGLKPEYKYNGLFVGLSLGFIFGLAQQMQGAHFLSHDLFSLAICWFISFGLFILFFRKRIVWL